ncbi:MAG: V-type ATPase subunit [Oscillospiraceae bacterium]|nr:V-type ATPase subunit [Oscillospiraceae bacterium]
MMSGLMQYGAVQTKIRAMFGQRLRTEDYEHIAAQKSEEEILDYLRQRSGWSEAVSELSAVTASGGFVGRIELETALRGQLYAEYSSLMHYVGQKDIPLLRVPVRNAERQAILNTMRRLKSGGYYKGKPPENKFLAHSKLSADALEQCKDYDGLIAAAGETIFADALRHLRPQTEETLPEYAAVDSLLQITLESYQQRLIDAYGKKKTKALLRKSHGMQIDFLNIIHILRLKRYYPHAPNELYMMALIPSSGPLRGEQLRQMVTAPDLESTLALLQDSPYRKYFAQTDVGELEEEVRRMLYLLFRRHLVSDEPSVHTLLVYFQEKEFELQTLINVIESVKYGVAYDAAMVKLAGM